MCYFVTWSLVDDCSAAMAVRFWRLHVSTNCVICEACEELGAVALIIGELVGSSCVQL